MATGEKVWDSLTILAFYKGEEVQEQGGKKRNPKRCFFNIGNAKC